MTKAASFLILLLSFLVPVSAFAAGGALFLSPESGTHGVGQKFSVQVYVDTGGIGASAAEAEISFDPSALSVDHSSTAGSLIGSWAVPPSFSNAAGTVRFTGWLSQYYAGSNGLLLTLTFTALRTTTTSIRFVSGTILDSGATDSNIITSMRSAVISILPQEILPSAPPPASVPPTAPPPPSAPTLTASQSAIHVGEHLIFKGSAEPNATVYLWLQEGEDPPTSSMITTGSDGSFMYVSAAPARAGVYRLWAQTEGSDGQKSALSQKSTVTIQADGVAAAILAGDVTGNLPLGIEFFLVAVLGIGYGYHRYRIRKRKRAES